MAERPGAPPVTATPEAMQKRKLRQVAAACRNGLEDSVRRDAAKQALLNLLRTLELGLDSVVASFWPIGCELDTRPLCSVLSALDVTCCLPRMAGKGRPLVFHRYHPGDALLEGPMRVFEPLPDMPVCRPDIVIVPMLAFDDEGYRLGYGGGFYDRTLSAYGASVTAIGIAFAAQRMPVLPREPGDVRLRTIVTEAGVHRYP